MHPKFPDAGDKRAGYARNRSVEKDPLPLLERAIPLLYRLGTSPGTIHFFANIYKVSTRTIQRELEFLRDKGFPIIIDPDTGQVSLVSDFGVPSIDLTCDEALAILVLFGELGDRISQPVFTSIQTACYKILARIPKKLLPVVESFQDKLQVIRRSDHAGSDYTGTFDQLLDAMNRRRVTEIEYTSPAMPGLLRTTLHPYTALFGRSWYIIGYSGLYRSVRTFKVSRISHINILEETFDKPSQFSLDDYLGNAWYLIRESEPDSEVVLRFSKLVAKNVAEVKWHRTQDVRWLDTGQVELRFQVSGLNEILWWILGYGAEAEVISPPRLRKLVAQHVKRLSALYADS